LAAHGFAASHERSAVGPTGRGEHEVVLERRREAFAFAESRAVLEMVVKVRLARVTAISGTAEELPGLHTVADLDRE
jgi:hypothetical protein